MSIEDPANFESPLSRENVVDKIREIGITHPESLDLLEKFAIQKEVEFSQEGRTDARLESLREKAYVLRMADCFPEAIAIMNTVLEIARQQGDSESVAEALWTIGKLSAHLPAPISADAAEKPSTLESAEKITREEVLEAFKKLITKGTDPIDLDNKDPEVQAAHKMLETWDAQNQSEDPNSRARHEFEKTMLFVDAGFHDPMYLGEVLGWLFQDSADIPKIEGDQVRAKLRNDMANAMRKIQALLEAERK